MKDKYNLKQFTCSKEGLKSLKKLCKKIESK